MNAANGIPFEILSVFSCMYDINIPKLENQLNILPELIRASDKELEIISFCRTLGKLFAECLLLKKCALK